MKKVAFVLVAILLAAILMGGCAAKRTAPVVQAPAPAADPNVITGISVSGDKKGSQVTIRGKQPLKYTAKKSPYGDAVVLYFQGSSLGDAVKDMVPKDLFVGKVTCAQSSGGEPVGSRIEIVLNEDVPDDDIPFEVNEDGDTVIVTLGEVTTETAISEEGKKAVAVDDTASKEKAVERPSEVTPVIITAEKERAMAMAIAYIALTDFNVRLAIFARDGEMVEVSGPGGTKSFTISAKLLKKIQEGEGFWAAGCKEQIEAAKEILGPPPKK